MSYRVPRSRAAASLLIQLLATIGIVGGLVAAPPANGRMMLVPLSAGAAQGMAATAIDKGASLIGQGPLPGSIVVDGNRDVLFRTLLNRGVALLAAPVTGCGQ